MSDVHKDFKELNIDVKEENIVPTGDDNKGFAVRTLGVLSKDEIAKTKTFFNDKYGTDPNVSTVSPTIGKEIARNAFIAVLIASCSYHFIRKYSFPSYVRSICSNRIIT